MADWYWYEQIGEEELCLLRVFGTSPEVVIPEKIAGRKVVGLGAYCFAEKNRALSYEICSQEMSGKQAEKEFQRLLERGLIRDLSGRYIQKVILPESIAKIGNFCFYQCSKLEEIVVGSALTEIGSDAFMNCLKLQKIILLGSVTEPCGLKQILGQRALETEVDFVVKGKIEAALIYPEYSEFYDEIGPAHIFKLNIEGEGFRARQCFQNAVVDLLQYDAGFMQASVRESEKTLCRMAWMRLYYSVGLRREYKEQYEAYLREHEEYAGRLLVKERNITLLQFAGEQGYFTKNGVEVCIQTAVLEGWTEGAGMLLQYQKKWFEKEEKEEYSFDDF